LAAGSAPGVQPRVKAPAATGADTLRNQSRRDNLSDIAVQYSQSRQRAQERGRVVLDSARDSGRSRRRCRYDLVQITMRGRVLALPSRFRAAVWAAAIAVVAQALLLLWAGRPSSRPLWGDEGMYWDVARRLADGQPSGLDPLWPPLYPYFLAAAGLDAHVVQALQCVLLAASAWLLYDIAVRLTHSVRVGAAAAVLLLLDAQVTAFATYYWPEIPHLFLLLSIAWILTARRGEPRWGLPLGVAIGLALLTKNLLEPFVPVLFAVWLIGTGRRGIIGATLAAIALAMTVAPAAIDNRQRHGAYFVGDSAAFNVLVGLRDTERRNFVNDAVGVEFARYVDSAPAHAERVELLWQQTHAFVDDRGLSAVLVAQLRRQYFRLFDRESFFTDQLPGGILFDQGRGYRDMPPWLGTTWRVFATILYAGVLITAPFGAARLFRLARGPAILALTYVGYVLAISLVVHVKTRHRVQVLPVFYLLSALTLAIPGGLPAAGAPRLAAAVCAVVLLLLAFGGAWLP
jgi:4-amino-4-deoxy-L-arabinose transferase-like glycosyltransferase